MARSRLDDLLQVHTFWLMDVVPTIQPPFFVFDGSMGFESVTAPEITLSETEIEDGNALVKRVVVGKGSVSKITLRRGVRYWDTEFWSWLSDAMRGKASPRKTLALLHLHKVGKTIAPSALFMGLSDQGYAVGRAWLLFNCLPSRYKAGSDFDAKGSEVSIAELDVTYEGFEEVNLAR